VASEVFWPFNLDQNGGGMIPPLPIPNTQSVVGLRFFDQSAVFVPGFNALGLVSLPSYGWGIGTGLTPAAATVSLIHETGQPDGGLYPGGAGRVAFSYQ
jgi:hypothetical protein